MRGKLNRIGRFPRNGSITPQFDPKEVFGCECSYCGHIQLFNDNKYRIHAGKKLVRVEQIF